ncbi:L-serine ammonia-lyase [Luteococcus sp. OSA5]|uniref:L-serine ammonia-lyase n=1 Tax=Luteococcus sp. OSA5 TaxID=3401630 RepID=UPI003B42940F
MHTWRVAISSFDMFKIGIGPSSSHTVGPMRAAATFTGGLVRDGLAQRTTRVQAQLFGSLGATGHGHGSKPAVVLGLEGALPESVDTHQAPVRTAEVERTRRIRLGSPEGPEIDFDPAEDLVMHRTRRLDFHTNGMVFTAWEGDQVLQERTFYSIGGGFVLEDDGSGSPRITRDTTRVPFDYRSGAELLAHCRDHRLRIPEVQMANELALGRTEQEVRDGLLRIWQVMDGCIAQGCATSGVLPGGLKVRRRAHRLYLDLTARSKQPPGPTDPLAAMDWLTLWALAVNEENAAGGRVVTAPTNGAAGIIPSVLKYVMTFMPGACDETVVDFLLTAGAIGGIYQQSASISGAEVGCQGEVGVAGSMASAGLCQVLGGSPQQVSNAAEIGLEHHLGLTCDPVGGLVQIPCIERNAMASVQAITAGRLALQGDGQQIVSLDQVIKTMMQTGADMKTKYKETARGGLAVNIVEC